ncbi:MAG: hypothetical protein OEL53_01060 [Rhodospirillales bacterium]|nr:hypothetical protein [Rhodospirillales bacterium]
MAGLDPLLSGLNLAMVSKTAGIAPHIEETGLQDLKKRLTLRKPRSGCLEGRGAAFSGSSTLQMEMGKQDSSP